MTTVGSRPHLVTGERVRLRFLESSNDCCHQLKLEDYSERAMKIVLVAWVAHKTGMQCSIRSNLLPTFSRCAAVNYYTLYSAREIGIYCCVTVPHKYEFAALNFIVLKLMYQALISA